MKFHFIGKPVSPTPFPQLGAKLRIHDLHDSSSISVGVKIEIAPQIWPVIQRLDNCDRATVLLERRTDPFQKAQGMVNSKALLLQRDSHKLEKMAVSGRLKDLLKSLKRAHDDMIGRCQRLKWFEALRSR